MLSSRINEEDQTNAPQNELCGILKEGGFSFEIHIRGIQKMMENVDTRQIEKKKQVSQILGIAVTSLSDNGHMKVM